MAVGWRLYSHADNTLAPHEQMYWKWRDTTTRPKKEKKRFLYIHYIPYSTISSSVITTNIFHRFTHLANEKDLPFFGSDCCTSVGAFCTYNTYWHWSCQAPSIDVLEAVTPKSNIESNSSSTKEIVEILDQIKKNPACRYTVHCWALISFSFFAGRLLHCIILYTYFDAMSDLVYI